MDNKARIRNLAVMIAVLPILAGLLWGCSKGTGELQATGPEIALPDMPFWENDTMEIDEDFLLPFAEDYCTHAGSTPSAEEFFLGDLPMMSADQLCGSVLDTGGLLRLLGNLFISGYFGGIWLRDVLVEKPVEAAVEGVKEAALTASEGTEQAGVDSNLRGVFNGVTKIAGALVDTARREAMSCSWPAGSRQGRSL